MKKLLRKINDATFVFASAGPILLFQILYTCSLVFAQAPWPGQNGNLVGYAAYGNGVVGGGACPAPSSGSAGSPTITQNCAYSTAQTISCNFCWFIQVDFQSGAGGVSVTGSNDLFLGSRFQSNQVAFYNVLISGSNLTFLYDSFTPLTSFYTAPPNEVWPSSGSALNTITQVTDVNSINGNDGYQYGIRFNGSANIYIDHCDLWGFGNSIDFHSVGAGTVNVINTWIHDAANASPQSYHTDGPGYLDNTAAPSNVNLVGNVVASLGNTNALAYQAATSGYDKMNVVSNFWSGFGLTLSPGDIAPQHLTNSSLVLNTFGTDVEHVFGIFHGTTLGTNTVWACNKLSFRAGTTWTDGDGWTPTSAIDGKYWLMSNNSPDSTTDNGGNTVCVGMKPSSLNFGGQPTSTTSAVKSIVISCTNTAACTFSSIALTTGTQFAIFSNNCSTGIASGATCTVNLTFTPTTKAVQSDSLVIASNNPAPANSLSVPLVGVGGLASSTVVTPAPALVGVE